GWLFFFFQAEDGIRDWSVTGVQTCALPIWGNIEAIADQSFELALKRDGTSEEIAYDQIAELRLADLYYKAKGNPDPTQARRTVRSEERRVGKKGRRRGGL